MTFEKFETGSNHNWGKLVSHKKTLLAVGGATAMVEELDPAQLYWTEHPMSPIEGNSSMVLSGFTALSFENSLLIFGQLYLIK